jgi:hypothetical protein
MPSISAPGRHRVCFQTTQKPDTQERLLGC